MIRLAWIRPLFKKNIILIFFSIVVDNRVYPFGCYKHWCCGNFISVRSTIVRCCYLCRSPWSRYFHRSFKPTSRSPAVLRCPILCNSCHSAAFLNGLSSNPRSIQALLPCCMESSRRSLSTADQQSSTTSSDSRGISAPATDPAARRTWCRHHHSWRSHATNARSTFAT